jgi:hypothetical protein
MKCECESEKEGGREKEREREREKVKRHVEDSRSFRLPIIECFILKELCLHLDNIC